MSGPCTDCGGPDYQTLEDRIAELEAEVHRIRMCYPGGEGEELLSECQLDLTQAEATIERLRVCGNCEHFDAEEFQYCAHPETLDAGYDGDMPYYISAPDKCDFTPTRWAERSTP